MDQGGSIFPQTSCLLRFLEWTVESMKSLNPVPREQRKYLHAYELFLSQGFGEGPTHPIGVPNTIEE